MQNTNNTFILFSRTDFNCSLYEIITTLLITLVIETHNNYIIILFFLARSNSQYLPKPKANVMSHDLDYSCLVWSGFLNALESTSNTIWSLTKPKGVAGVSISHLAYFFRTNLPPPATHTLITPLSLHFMRLCLKHTTLSSIRYQLNINNKQHVPVIMLSPTIIKTLWHLFFGSGFKREWHFISEWTLL